MLSVPLSIGLITLVVNTARSTEAWIVWAAVLVMAYVMTMLWLLLSRDN